MMTIKDRSKVPRDDFNYRVPESGRIFRANNIGLLVGSVKKHMLANNYTLPDNLFRVIEEDYCSRYPHYCWDADNPVQPDNYNDILTKVAAAVAIPAADVLAVVGKALKVHCSACAKRHGIIQRIQEIGLHEAIRQVKETFK